MTGDDFPARHFERSQHVLYNLFRWRKTHRIDDVAEQIGIPESTLQKYVTGVTACPIEILHKIFQITQDRMLRDLLTPPGFWLLKVRESKKPKTVTVVKNGEQERLRAGD